MQVTIQGRNLEVDDAMRDYIDRKVDRVGRHISATRSASVHLSHEQTRRTDQRFSAQITVDVNGSIVRSEERARTTKAAVDAAAHAIDRRVKRLKSRLYRSERAKHDPSSIRFEEAEESVPVEEDGKVVRVKRFPIKPMAVEEAIFEMDMLGHSFYLFLDMEDQKHHVLYRRKDGDYGLLIPESL